MKRNSPKLYFSKYINDNNKNVNCDTQMIMWMCNMILTYTQILYASNDTSSISAWCVHKAQTILSSEQYFSKNFLFSYSQDILNVGTVKHGPAQVDYFIYTDIETRSATGFRFWVVCSHIVLSRIFQGFCTRLVCMLQWQQAMICGRWTKMVICIAVMSVFFAVSRRLRSPLRLLWKMTGNSCSVVSSQNVM